MIGYYIRDTVLPILAPGKNVTQLAKTLGVGRVALSKLLNGRSELSVEMAWRLERALGVDGLALLQMQVKECYFALQGRK